MTTGAALALLQQVGSVQVDGDKLKLRIPRRLPPDVSSAIEVLRCGKQEAIRILASPGILASIPLDAQGEDWEVWFARTSNEAWVTEGYTGQPGRLKPGTVAHGIEQERRKLERDR